MIIQNVEKYDEHLLSAINHLLLQLSSSAETLSRAQLHEIIDSTSTQLLTAIENEQLCGMLSLVIFSIPTGTRAWIEDVVVDEHSRGKGVASALLEHASHIAITKGAKTLDLTSRPQRDAANSLYRKYGFTQRQTNVYRLVL